jgi:hypothetical protein
MPLEPGLSCAQSCFLVAGKRISHFVCRESVNFADSDLVRKWALLQRNEKVWEEVAFQ